MAGRSGRRDKVAKLTGAGKTRVLLAGQGEPVGQAAAVI
jgi:hypothetical protein